MKRKGVVFSILALVLVAGLTVAGLTVSEVVGAVNKTAVETSSKKTTVTAGSEDITPFAVGNRWRGVASGSNQVSSSFVVPGTYGHVKLYFLNKGTSTTTISVTHVENGLVYFTKTVAAGRPLTWRSVDEGYSQGMRAGSYIVTYRSASANVKVSYSGFASNNAEETKK